LRSVAFLFSQMGCCMRDGPRWRPTGRRTTFGGFMAEKLLLGPVLGSIKDRNGVSYNFDKSTHVAIRDSKGNVRIFAKNERSAGTVNNRLYSFYAVKRFAEPKGRQKKEKPFVASVTPFEPKAKAFIPFVNHKEESN
jgi:hypothetical protein